MAKGQKDILLGLIREGKRMSLGQQIQLALMLSLPAILAQTSSMSSIAAHSLTNPVPIPPVAPVIIATFFILDLQQSG